MSSVLFPTLAGLGWSVTRAPVWQTRVQQSISGKETRLADWSYPRWQWSLTFDVLRQGAVGGQTFAEFETLAGFVNARQGRFDSFLYQDADDNAVTGQQIGTGDGATTVFQLVRAFGSFIEPVLAPLSVTNVYVNGVAATGWNVTSWGAQYLESPFGTSPNLPGQVSFTAAPASGAAITADFSFAFPCRFDQDATGFEKFMAGFYALKKLSFTSLK